MSGNEQSPLTEVPPETLDQHLLLLWLTSLKEASLFLHQDKTLWGKPLSLLEGITQNALKDLLAVIDNMDFDALDRIKERGNK